MVAYRRVTNEQIHAIKTMSAVNLPVKTIAESQGLSQPTVRYWARKEPTKKAVAEASKQSAKPGAKPVRALPEPEPKVSPATLARREKLKALAGKKTTVKHRTFRTYACGSGSLQAGLAREYGVRVSKATIRRDMRALNWRYYVRTAVMHLNKGELKTRKAFAKAYKVRRFARRMVFTDEKSFTCADCTGRYEWAPSKQQVTKSDNASSFQDTVYVWGAIGYNFRHLVVIRKDSANQRATRRRNSESRDDREQFTSRTYITRCLAGKVQRHLKDTRIDGEKLILQADNHRAHYSREAKAYMERMDIDWTDDWPARSPDMNPIENLWAYMAREVSKAVPLTADDLEAEIWKVWDAMTDEFVNPYVESFSSKCQRVFQRNGLTA